MTDIPPSLDPRQAAEVLASSGLALSAFRRKLAQAGYPFTEPPNITRIIEQIDALLFPDLISKNQARG